MVVPPQQGAWAYPGEQVICFLKIFEQHRDLFLVGTSFHVLAKTSLNALHDDRSRDKNSIRLSLGYRSNGTGLDEVGQRRGGGGYGRRAAKERLERKKGPQADGRALDRRQRYKQN